MLRDSLRLWNLEFFNEEKGKISVESREQFPETGNTVAESEVADEGG